MQKTGVEKPKFFKPTMEQKINSTVNVEIKADIKTDCKADDNTVKIVNSLCLTSGLMGVVGAITYGIFNNK